MWKSLKENRKIKLKKAKKGLIFVSKVVILIASRSHKYKNEKQKTIYEKNINISLRTVNREFWRAVTFCDTRQQNRLYILKLTPPN